MATSSFGCATKDPDGNGVELYTEGDAWKQDPHLVVAEARALEL